MAKLDFPVATVDGQVWTGTNGVIYTYVGTPPNGYWQGITGDYAQGSNANIHVGDTPPLDPEPGNLWWDSSNDSGRLYMFYEDVDSSQWVEASPSGTGEDAEDGEPTLWDKNGNDLEPKVATDNVVIGGDKITLNATDGSITAAGYVFLNGDKGYFAQKRTNVTGKGIYLAYYGSDYLEKAVEILSDGSINAAGAVSASGGIADTTGAEIGDGYSFVRNDDSNAAAFGVLNGGSSSTDFSFSVTGAGNVRIGGLIPSAPNIELNADGSINAKIIVKVGTTGSSAGTQGGYLWAGDAVNNYAQLVLYANTETAAVIQVVSAPDSSTTKTVRSRFLADGKLQIGTDLNSLATTNIELNADGSAEFAGNVIVGDNYDVYIGSTGFVQAHRGDPGVSVGQFTGGSNGDIHFQVTPEGILTLDGTNAIVNANIQLNGMDGNAIFKGAVQTAGGVVTPSMVLQLETDNPANYTTTTDGEGVETQVYNGPVLDVKALLLTLQTAASRIESLETAKASLEARLTALEGAN